MNYNWEDCLYLKNHDIINFYNNRQEATLFILGKGFDPRMCVGVEQLILAIKNLEIILLEYDEGPNSSSLQYADLTQKNYEKLLSITKVRSLKIPLIETILPAFLKDNFSLDEINKYHRVVIDISAMPYSISFNLIKYFVNATKGNTKIDVLVCDNSTFDDAILPTGLAESANYLNGFNVFSMSLESEEDAVTIWLPLLGKNCKDELDKIYPFVTPDEICPILPFPSINPRKADEILLFLGEQLFMTFDVDRKNIIYVAESNITQVYKKICSVVEYYNDALQLINNSKNKFVFSTAASKLISLGALLASLEISSQKITTSFVLVNNDGYHLNFQSYKPDLNNLHCICLYDNIYEW